ATFGVAAGREFGSGRSVGGPERRQGKKSTPCRERRSRAGIAGSMTEEGDEVSSGRGRRVRFETRFCNDPAEVA
ncbi:hypothetical protein LINGRAHAP2_LOCUS3946, partial [Linum grandiflorum]